MEAHSLASEATWMVPALVGTVVGLIGALVGLVVWAVNKFIDEAKEAGGRFRTDVVDRLKKQDDVLAAQNDFMRVNSSHLSAIKDLLTTEVHKLREKLVNHDVRITAVEGHLFQRRREDRPRGVGEDD